VDDVRQAAGKRVDAALLSPIFGSPRKGEPLGVETIRQARDVVGSSVHLVALGGVDEKNAVACAEAGADGVAVIRALLKTEDVRAVARTLAAPFLPS
jgi:thiamine-phosphate pyrophosphorylase